MAAKNSPKATANEFTLSYAVSRLLSALPAARKAKAEKTHPVLCGFVAAFDAELCLPRFKAMPDLIAFREYLERLGAESDPDVGTLAAEAEAADLLGGEPVPDELPELTTPGPVVEVDMTPAAAGPEDNPAEEEWNPTPDELPTVENTPDPVRVDPPAVAPEPAGEPGDLSDAEREAMAAAMGDDDTFSLDDESRAEAAAFARDEARATGARVADDDTFSLSEDAPAVAVAEPEQDVVRFRVASLGVTYAGRCVKCGDFTGRSDWDRGRTLLVKRPNDKFAVAHPECAGGRVKNRVNGGSRYDGPTEFRCVDAS